MASPPIPAAGLLYVRHDERADRAVITAEPEAHMPSPRGGGPKGKRNGVFKHGLYTKRQWKNVVSSGTCFDNPVGRWSREHAASTANSIAWVAHG